MQPTQITVADPSGTPADTLRVAAGYLLNFGWYQGDLFDWDALDEIEDASALTPPACALGAIRVAAVGSLDDLDWSPEQVDRHAAAVAALADFLILYYGVESPDVVDVLDSGMACLDQVVIDWNDDTRRIGSHVMAALHGAAEAWERLHQPVIAAGAA